MSSNVGNVSSGSYVKRRTLVMSVAERQIAGDHYGELLRGRGYDWDQLTAFHRHSDQLIYEMRAVS